VIPTGKTGRLAWEDKVDEILGCTEDYEREVCTQDLLTTQDFGGAQALIDLQSKQPEDDKNSPPYDKNSSTIRTQPTSLCLLIEK
jgi:hypothetical protein